MLLEGDWRTRLTGAGLAGLAGRAGLRARIGELLLASELVYAGQGYCIALASFGTREDATLLIRYLERYLPQTQLRYDQEWAFGALLHIDEKLGTRFVRQFAGEDGRWRRWAEAGSGPPLDPDRYRRLIGELCALAADDF